MPIYHPCKSHEQYNQAIDNAINSLPCGKIIRKGYKDSMLKMHMKVCEKCAKGKFEDMASLKMFLPTSQALTNKSIRKGRNKSGEKIEKLEEVATFNVKSR